MLWGQACNCWGLVRWGTWEGILGLREMKPKLDAQGVENMGNMRAEVPHSCTPVPHQTPPSHPHPAGPPQSVLQRLCGPGLLRGRQLMERLRNTRWQLEAGAGPRGGAMFFILFAPREAAQRGGTIPGMD